MARSIFFILSQYGFEARKNNKMWWGCGSLVWGTIAEVTSLGNDFYKIHFQKWLYDCYGDCITDIDTTAVYHGAKLLEFVFENVPF